MGTIAIPYPAMAVHSSGVPGWKYQMYNTWYLSENDTLEHICGWIRVVALRAPGSRLRCLILNSHGSCGHARLSTAASLLTAEAVKFAVLRGLVDHLIIVSCNVIGSKSGDKHTWSDPGVQLCRALAQYTNARVYAANAEQYVEFMAKLFGGPGEIDELEGEILAVSPSAIEWINNRTLELRLRSM